MAAPVVTAVPIGSYTKVATAVTSVRITALDSGTYYWTYRLTAAGAPTLLSEGIDMSLTNGQILTFSASSDVYCWNTGPVAGTGVRVDA